jgi:hypothetical protein
MPAPSLHSRGDKLSGVAHSTADSLQATDNLFVTASASLQANTLQEWVDELLRASVFCIFKTNQSV